MRWSVGWGVGTEMGCAEGEGRFAAWTEVGFEGVPDAGMGLRQVILKCSYTIVSTGSS